ncbi:MAG: hypothetical protein U0793_26560 [Gemmataceae bacterium]
MKTGAITFLLVLAPLLAGGGCLAGALVLSCRRKGRDNEAPKDA